MSLRRVVSFNGLFDGPCSDAARPSANAIAARALLAQPAGVAFVSQPRFNTAAGFPNYPRSPFTGAPAHQDSASLQKDKPQSDRSRRYAIGSLLPGAVISPILPGLTLPDVIVDPSNYYSTPK
jgi:hypothetical protein